MILNNLVRAIIKEETVMPWPGFKANHEQIKEFDLKAIESAEKFDFKGYPFGELDDSIRKDAGRVWNEGLLGAPAEITYYEKHWTAEDMGPVATCIVVHHVQADEYLKTFDEYPNEWKLLPDYKLRGHLITENIDCFCVMAFVYSKRSRRFARMPFNYILLRGGSDEIQSLSVPSPAVLWGESAVDFLLATPKLQDSWVSLCCGSAVELSYILNIKGNSVAKMSAPAMYFAGKKQLPKYEYKKITVRPGEATIKPIKKKGQESGSRESPRLHLRRGHIRRQKKGKLWIRPAWVGDAKRGVIKKDYEVRPVVTV